MTETSDKLHLVVPVDIYSITGFIHQICWGDILFGGFFTLQNKGLEGRLIDYWGASVIHGRMNDDELEFEKKYITHIHSHITSLDAVSYLFKKNEKGIWIGEYSGSFCGKGRAVCIIKPDWKDIGMTYPVPEDCAKDVVISGVDNGLFEVYKDPNTGEGMIKLRDENPS
jgi:hypothetical protein